MEKLSMILMICVTLITLPLFAHGVVESPGAVEKWFGKLPHAKEKLTKLHFYFHDTPSSKNPTAVQVAEANSSSSSPTSFGIVSVMDDPLTVGPELASKMVGRAEGIYASVSQEEFDLLMSFNFVFTSGKYNGSTLSVLGHNRILRKYRELPILGGSGVFRLARGIATAKTYSFNTTSGNAVVEYSVIVLHY